MPKASRAVRNSGSGVSAIVLPLGKSRESFAPAEDQVDTVGEIPEFEILHHHSPSPFTPLGAKGLAEGNCMSTPASIANAIADALGAQDIILPATPRRIHALMQGGKQ
jgi:hypothetical protein